ncbi:MAG TPA: autotransporter domain-containing protein [Casimicrobiaceae bacterium]|nr:autotransporter domain-containing protein [Casimicrobiaceae bacterium]
MRSLRVSLVASALAAALSAGDASAQFTNIYFFGDSLTDAGSFRPVLPPGTGLFTTNPGPIWAQVLAARYGLTAIPANQGGTDFAQGGARVTGLPGVPATLPTGTATPIATQVSQLTARGPLDSGALYALWGGGNDILFQLEAAATGAVTPAQAQANVAASAVALVQQVGVLQASGARNIVVMNLPDIGRSPGGTASGQSAQLSAISNLFNSTLIAGLDTLGGSTIRVNTFGLFNEMLANPAAFGFVNATSPACGATPSLLCTSANLVGADAARTFFFADDVHPTTAGHAVIAQAVESMLEGPAQIGALAEAPLAVEKATFRAIDGRMFSSLNAPRSTNRFDAWVSYDYGHNDIDGRSLSGNADVNTVVAGGDMKVSERMLIGIAFSYSDNKGDFGATSGGYKLKETTGTIYAGYGEGPWYLGATLGAGDLDFSDVHRNIQLGALSRTESGETRGWQAMGSVLGGYWFTYNDWLHGPFARVSYQEIHVRGFSERGSDSTALSYGEQERDSLVTSLGWQVAGRIANVRPFARVTWEMEAKDDDRSVQASSVTLGGSYSVSVIKPDRDYAQYLVGASADFSGFTGFLTGSGTSGRSDGDAYAVTVGVRVPF